MKDLWSILSTSEGVWPMIYPDSKPSIVERLEALELCVRLLNLGLGKETTEVVVDDAHVIVNCAVDNVAMVFVPLCFWIGSHCKDKDDAPHVVIRGEVDSANQAFASIIGTCMKAMRVKASVHWTPSSHANTIGLNIQITDTALTCLWASEQSPPAIKNSIKGDANKANEELVLYFKHDGFSIPSSIIKDSPSNPPLLVIGPNPAYQKSLKFGKLSIGEVNRASSLTIGCGGKGQHCAMAINTCQISASCIVQFLGRDGDAGKYIQSAMRDEGSQQLIGWFPGTTRTCTTLLCGETGAMTELIEPSDSVTSECVTITLQAVVDQLPNHKGIALCGTFPPGVDETFYGTIANKKREGCVMLLDGVKGVLPALRTGNIDVLKINIEELFMLVGRSKEEREEEIIQTAAILFQKGLLPPQSALALTAGPNQAHLFEGNGMHYRYSIPPIKALNPIGAGDTCSGVTLYMMAVAMMPIGKAFGWGLAAATASCLNLQGAHFLPADLLRLHSMMEIETELWSWQ